MEVMQKYAQILGSDGDKLTDRWTEHVKLGKL